MMHTGNSLVIIDEQDRRDIIHNIHQNLVDNAKAVSLSLRLGRRSTYNKIKSRFYWYMIVSDVTEYIRTCTKGQRSLLFTES